MGSIILAEGDSDRDTEHGTVSTLTTPSVPSILPQAGHTLVAFQPIPAGFAYILAVYGITGIALFGKS